MIVTLDPNGYLAVNYLGTRQSKSIMNIPEVI